MPNSNSNSSKRVKDNKKIDSKSFYPVIDMKYPLNYETMEQTTYDPSNDALKQSIKNGYFNNRHGRVKCRETRIWEISFFII